MNRVKKCNLVYPYFNNPRMLQLQVDNWNSFSRKLREIIRIVLIDDNSDQPALPVFRDCSVAKSLLRFTQPALWTMHEARNLGAFFSAGQHFAEWLLMSDMDHVITQGMLERLLDMDLNQARYYTFSRVRAPGMQPLSYHCNSFLVTERAYCTINGYDVDFCGAHGGGYGGDTEFCRQLNEITPRVHLDEIQLIKYERSLVMDANTTTWDRAEWRAKYQIVAKRKRKAGLLRSTNPVRRSWEQLI